MTTSTTAPQTTGAATRQGLDRALKVAGNVAITVSSITPAASVFVIAPVAFQIAGTGVVYSFLLATVISVALAFCFAELGSTYPVTGGEYALVLRSTGRPLGFLSLAVMMVQIVFVPSSLALGAGEYVHAVWPGAHDNLIGAAFIVAATLIAIANLKFGAVASGIFLAIEIGAIVVVSVLGFVHADHPVSSLLTPHAYSAAGAPAPVATGLLLAAAAPAGLALAGYGNATILSEEMDGSRRKIAKAVFLSLGIGVVAELVPVVAALVGAPSLAKLVNAASPMSYLVRTLGGGTLNTVVSLGIAVAILNAVIAIMVHFSRILYSSGRDRAWPGPVNTWLSAIHPRFCTPWIAAALLGVGSAVLTYASNIAVVVTFVSLLAGFNFLLVAVGALVSRIRHRQVHRPYRMPLWPAAPLVAIGGSLFVIARQQEKNLVVLLCIALAAALYYGLYLARRSGKWVIAQEPERQAEPE